MTTPPQAPVPTPDPIFFEQAPESRTYIHTRCGNATTVSGNDYRRLCNPFDTAGGTICAHCNHAETFGNFTWVDTGEKLSAYRWKLLLRSPAKGGLSWPVRIALLLILPAALTVFAYTSTQNAPAKERAAALKVGPAMGVVGAGVIIMLAHRFRPVDNRRYR